MENFEPSLKQVVDSCMYQDSEISRAYIKLKLDNYCMKIREILKQADDDLLWKQREYIKKRVNETIEVFCMERQI